MQSTSRLLTTKEAASLLGVSEQWLNQDRRRDKPRIPFIRVGEKLVRYEDREITGYIRSRSQETGARSRRNAGGVQ